MRPTRREHIGSGEAREAGGPRSGCCSERAKYGLARSEEQGAALWDARGRIRVETLVLAGTTPAGSGPPLLGPSRHGPPSVTFSWQSVRARTGVGR